jgi:signal recognition particle receptor subunit beta
MKIDRIQDSATEIRVSARPTNLGSGLEALAKFADRARRLEEILETLSGLSGEGASAVVGRLTRSMAEFEPSITVLGQVKSGKTTLVNALAGWPDLLPADVNPWTSVVTSLHLEPGSIAADSGVRFQFMTEEEWDRLASRGGRIGELASRAGAESELRKIGEQIEKLRSKAKRRLGRKFELLLGEEHEYGYFDKNLLERYICLGDDFFDSGDDTIGSDHQGRFADITRSADLYLNGLTVPYRICVKDTPGVNDTFMMREQLTIQAIRESRLCLVVLSAGQALTTVDMGLIRLITNLNSRDVIIFVNRIDELADPVNQISEIEQSIRETLREKNGPEGVEIVFGSAYWANKALSPDIDDMPDASKRALYEWAEASFANGCHETEPHNIMWELSGLPALFRAISERIVEGAADPFLKKTASSALTIATSQQAAASIRINAEKATAQMSMHDTVTELDRLAGARMEALESRLEETISGFHERVDKIHAKFIERSVQSLIAHLESHGPDVVWEYDPTGLRMLLRSAYSVFGARVKAHAEKQYELALTDVAEFYARAFGPSVNGIQMSGPSVARLPPPIAIGQTIALDFTDGWWVSWWRRLRGYQAFSRRFHDLIASETEDFMTQLKSVQVDTVREQTLAALTEFFDQQREILRELGTSRDGAGDLQNLFSQNKGNGRDETVEGVLETLRAYAA